NFSSLSVVFFAFCRALIRLTMDVFQAMLSRRGLDARQIDRCGIFSEGVEECRGRKRIDHARNAPAHEVHLFHRLPAEGILRAARDPDPMLDVRDRVIESQRTEAITEPDAL